jgi:hypothetical protein
MAQDFSRELFSKAINKARLASPMRRCRRCDCLSVQPPFGQDDRPVLSVNGGVSIA